MRISDWSSDVCSSDLGEVQPFERAPPIGPIDEVVPVRDQIVHGTARVTEGNTAIHAAGGLAAHLLVRRGLRELRPVAHPLMHRRAAPIAALELQRSEEHTSELQSLMRISYAVLC